MTSHTHDQLVARLNAICDAQPFAASWHFRNLRTGAVADRAGNVPTPSASTRKIVYLMAALTLATAVVHVAAAFGRLPADSSGTDSGAAPL